jgi:hypothetical protein
MRTQSIELLNIAKELREYVKSLNLPLEFNAQGEPTGIALVISDNSHLTWNAHHNYFSMDCNPWPKPLEMRLFQRDAFVNNTITMNAEELTDEDLDAIVLRTKEDIAIFKASNLPKDVQSS